MSDTADAAEYTMIFDVEQRRPACVLIQAAYGCGTYPAPLHLFSSKSWLVAPTDGMRRIRGTMEQWSALADIVNKETDG